MENKTNGSDMAYPIVCEEVRGVWQQGLTKREYIATMAMQGLCAMSISGTHKQPQNLAKEAVQYANCLIDELNKNGNN